MRRHFPVGCEKRESEWGAGPRSILLTVIAAMLISSVAHGAHFKDNGDGTVTDWAGGIMWQQAEGGLRSWYGAVHYCRDLTLAEFDDWRLPTVAELRSLVADERGYPKIDTDFFPDFPATRVSYWSATDNERDWRMAKGLVFTFGTEYDLRKAEHHRVRCVRSIQ